MVKGRAGEGGGGVHDKKGSGGKGEMRWGKGGQGKGCKKPKEGVAKE